MAIAIAIATPHRKDAKPSKHGWGRADRSQARVGGESEFFVCRHKARFVMAGSNSGQDAMVDRQPRWKKVCAGLAYYPFPRLPARETGL